MHIGQLVKMHLNDGLFIDECATESIGNGIDIGNIHFGYANIGE